MKKPHSDYRSGGAVHYGLSSSVPAVCSRAARSRAARSREADSEGAAGFAREAEPSARVAAERSRAAAAGQHFHAAAERCAAGWCAELEPAEPRESEAATPSYSDAEQCSPQVDAVRWRWCAPSTARRCYCSGAEPCSLPADAVRWHWYAPLTASRCCWPDEEACSPQADAERCCSRLASQRCSVAVRYSPHSDEQRC